MWLRARSGRFAAVLTLFAAMVCAQFLIAGHAVAADEFQAKDHQEDLAQLHFFYPQGYSDDTIISLENGRIPADMTVAEFSRLHCGESGRVVLNPCLVRYVTPKGAEFVVVAQGGDRQFSDVGAATDYFRKQLDSTVAAFGQEVDALNDYIEGFCTSIENGHSAREALSAQGDRPRL